MSLRTRLLIAIGVIAVVALAIADVATYSPLESFLYQRVDQQLGRYPRTIRGGSATSGRAISGVRLLTHPDRFAPRPDGAGPAGPGDRTAAVRVQCDPGARPSRSEARSGQVS